VGGADPRFRDAPVDQELAQVPCVGLVGLGSPLAPSQAGRVRRLRDVSVDTRPLELFDDVAPARTALHGERHVVVAREALEPQSKLLTVSGQDPPRRHLTRFPIEVVERDLRPVNVERSYDGHGTSSCSCFGDRHPLALC